MEPLRRVFIFCYGLAVLSLFQFDFGTSTEVNFETTMKVRCEMFQKFVKPGENQYSCSQFYSLFRRQLDSDYNKLRTGCNMDKLNTLLASILELEPRSPNDTLVFHFDNKIDDFLESYTRLLGFQSLYTTMPGYSMKNIDYCTGSISNCICDSINSPAGGAMYRFWRSLTGEIMKKFRGEIHVLVNESSNDLFDPFHSYFHTALKSINSSNVKKIKIVMLNKPNEHKKYNCTSGLVASLKKDIQKQQKSIPTECSDNDDYVRHILCTKEPLDEKFCLFENTGIPSLLVSLKISAFFILSSIILSNHF